MTGPVSPRGEVRPQATLVVVAFHRPLELARLLASTADPRVSLVVVDVEADEAVADVARRAGARLVTIEGNPGYASAVNAGAAVAGSDVVVFANDDLSCSADAVVALARRSTESGGVAVPRVNDRGGRPVRTVQATLNLRSLVVEWLLLPDAPPRVLAGRVRVEKWRTPSAPERIEAASAVMVAVPAWLLREEPLPERYGMYFEESEWFVRLARREVPVEYRPEIVVTHLGGRAVISGAKQALLARNAVRCLRALYGSRTAALGWPIVVAWHARLVAVAALHRAFGRGHARVRGHELLNARRAGLSAALRAWREVR